MITINSPPQHTLRASTGIDSVFVQFKELYKEEIDHFCRELGLSYKGDKRDKHTRTWTIFLAGGQPISVVYHFSSKTTTFQIGKLMNYSRNPNDQHEFLQRLMSRHADKPVGISGLHFAVDIKEPTGSLLLKSQQNLKSTYHKGSTIYFNGNGGTVFTMYDKALQMRIYSTTLTRLELRLAQQLTRWRVKDFPENRRSLDKLASKIEQHFEEAVALYSIDGKVRLTLAIGDVAKTLEDFIVFLHGGTLPPVKDHFKVFRAIRARDHFLAWMRDHNLRHPGEIRAFVKGKKAFHLDVVGMDHKTFNRAVDFYVGIPNFKVGSHVVNLRVPRRRP